MKRRYLRVLKSFSIGLLLVFFFISYPTNLVWGEADSEESTSVQLMQPQESEHQGMMMEDKVKETQALFTPDEAIINIDPEDNVIITLSNLNFEFGKSSLKSDYFPLLSKVQQASLLFPDRKMKITGHTDAVGDNEFNKRLSLERAKNVAQYLEQKLGVDAGRIEIMGAGESQPIASNATPKGRAMNRRIDVTFINPL